jgi:hypothetical protein
MTVPNLQSKPAAMRATIHIKRKATGVTETHEVVFTPVSDEPEPPQQTQSQEKE